MIAYPAMLDVPRELVEYVSKVVTLQPGESKQWPVTFVLDPKLPKDITTITLSYTFFEVGGAYRRNV